MRRPENMKEGREYWSTHWSDTMANFYIKQDGIITVETLYRFGKSPDPITYTIPEYNDWLNDIDRTREGIK